MRFQLRHQLRWQADFEGVKYFVYVVTENVVDEGRKKNNI
ncbi:hypothetical protein Krac_10680 [Ktedonobacter racemifer DSM 44963]|uniref:Uncharacterized protein n=1 Tax=Ktedonobacter racemifer DSM 44963 TaxID=485913 RepID=D6TI87_KTERA|nr:hypothetical protein Krac_10680 [Ktedonobacter racemifer DSM 44963]